MTIKKFFLSICLLLLPASLLAQEQAQIYVIKKGDTLWGISQRFLKDPQYWPNLWSNNPFVKNPHLIYPGQTIAIYNDRIELVPVDAAAAGDAGSAEALPVAEEAITIKVPLGSQGFIGMDAFAAAGTLVDAADNRLLLGTGDQVFLDMGSLAGTVPGEIYSLFAIKDQVLHPTTGRKLGYQVDELGTVRIVEINEQVATGEIVTAFKEIQRGARLRPYQPPQLEIALKQAPLPLTGTLIAAQEGKLALSQYDIVYLDLGADDGLQVGNLLYISRQRDPSAYGLKTTDLQLPDALLGQAVVVETQPRTAAALVLKVTEPLYRGDRLTTVTE